MNIAQQGQLRFICLILFLFTLNFATSLNAHEIRPALLEITEKSPGLYDVTWKVPTKGERALAISPVLPESFSPVGLPSNYMVPGAFIEQTTFKSDKSLPGKSILIEGLSGVQIDVLLQIELLDGSNYSAIIRPTEPTYQIPLIETKSEVAFSYWRMGFYHILDGIDHLLFLLALVFFIPRFKNLLWAVTAFTVAHSITLALATLGVLYVPSAPTEAVISLSIVFLAVEIIRKRSGENSLTERYPWIVAFIFGLFHGLGFAGALSEVGLPQHEIPLALLTFNVGVETGQVLFITIVAFIFAILRKVKIPYPNWSWRAVPYTIGSIAAFWTIQRTVSFFQ
jgi:hydrogenase/urease accessory protein HupE